MSFGSVLTAMVTPFDATGAVDYKKAQELALHLLANGSDGIVVCGTTGENPTLTREEKRNLLKAVLEVAKGKGTIIFGTTSNSYSTSLEVVQDAEELGADGVLAVVPYYNKPPQEGMYLHFKGLANSTKLPIILYNIPGRTGTKLQNETIIRLANDCPNIVAVKDSTGDLESISKLRAALPDDFMIYSGDDSLTLPILSVGGEGVISVVSHILGNEIAAMVKAFKEGNTKEATRLHCMLMPAFKGLFITANPIPCKTCLDELGWATGGCRLPLCGADEKTKEQMVQLLKQYNLL